ncbi:hypothetical protein PIB30_002517 [Stylosanthes scabra]|uniref:Uncharacterized protein n=1 Tax=Stylosanthes scabra TaxID=79078 RepID=A0ABU6Y4W2_9FABA|nr:hypothetical protein [Stylosanthes scabra]
MFQLSRPDCVTSPKWMVFVDENEKGYVGIGGQEFHAGYTTLYAPFSIHKSSHGYILKFCPETTCSNIDGSSLGNHVSLLNLVVNSNAEPSFQFALQKPDPNYAKIRTVV